MYTQHTQSSPLAQLPEPLLNHADGIRPPQRLVVAPVAAQVLLAEGGQLVPRDGPVVDLPEPLRVDDVPQLPKKREGDLRGPCVDGVADEGARLHSVEAGAELLGAERGNLRLHRGEREPPNHCILAGGVGLLDDADEEGLRAVRAGEEPGQLVAARPGAEKHFALDGGHSPCEGHGGRTPRGGERSREAILERVGGKDPGRGETSHRRVDGEKRRKD